MANLLCSLLGHNREWVYLDGTPRADGKIISYRWYVHCSRCKEHIQYPTKGMVKPNHKIDQNHKDFLPGESEKVRYERV